MREVRSQEVVLWVDGRRRVLALVCVPKGRQVWSVVTGAETFSVVRMGPASCFSPGSGASWLAQGQRWGC